MFLNTKRSVILTILFISALAGSSFGQAKPSDGTPQQRLDVMRDKLDRMRRSLTSSAAVLKEEGKDDKAKKDDKDKINTPQGRLLGLEKDAGRLASDVNNLRGNVVLHFQQSRFFRLLNLGVRRNNQKPHLFACTT